MTLKKNKKLQRQTEYAKQSGRMSIKEDGKSIKSCVNNISAKIYIWKKNYNDLQIENTEGLDLYKNDAYIYLLPYSRQQVNIYMCEIVNYKILLITNVKPNKQSHKNPF